MASMATERQVSFLQELGYQGDASALTKSYASETISRLIAARDAVKKAERQAQWATQPKAEPGYYVDGDDLYVVVLSKAGRPYAKKMTVRTDVNGKPYGKWEYAPGSVFALVQLPKLTVDEAARLSYLHGFCVVCGTRFTDKQSVAWGIGPTCYKNVTGHSRPKMSEAEVAERIGHLPQFAHHFEEVAA